MANRFSGEYRPPHEGGSVFRPYAPKNPHQQEQMFPKTRPDDERKNYEYPNKQHQEEVWTKPRPSKGGNFGPRKEEKNPHENIKTHRIIEPNGPYTVDPHDNEYKKAQKSPNYNNPPKKDGEGPKKGSSKGHDDWHKPEGGSSVSRKPKSPTKPSSGGMALPIPQKVK